MKWSNIAFGFGICPFRWQWGDVSFQTHAGRQFAIGPFRLAWRLG
jgi:hypothetical protein